MREIWILEDFDPSPGCVPFWEQFLHQENARLFLWTESDGEIHFAVTRSKGAAA